MVTVGDCEALCMNLVLHLGVCVRVVMYGCTTVGTTCMCACTSIQCSEVKKHHQKSITYPVHEEKNKNIQNKKQQLKNFHFTLGTPFYYFSLLLPPTCTLFTSGSRIIK